MFEALRAAFRQAVVNFHEELNRDLPLGGLESAFDGMRKEIDAATSKVAELRRELDETLAECAKEEELLRTCLRRRDQALLVEDLETVRVSEVFVERHRRRGEILRDKAAVLAREIDEWEGELSRMRESYDGNAAAVRVSDKGFRGGLEGS